ncbi:MAG: hypothetical protein IJ025_02365 [Clostridia bacterium]|nr:hypothetical protein [Clostridia bacterium]
MAKKGMKRPQRTHTQERNTEPPVPEIQGKAKSGKMKVKPIVTGTAAPAQKVFHSNPHTAEKNIPEAYSAIDTDLARDNIESDFNMTEADKQDI